MRDEGESAGGELRLRRADGVYRWHLWRSHPERDAQGRVVRWVGTCTDIQEQKRAEELLEQRIEERTAELRASEERFRQAFEFAGIGMAIVGLDGRWIRVNKSICEIVGYSQPELLTKTFQDITHPDDLAADLLREHTKPVLSAGDEDAAPPALREPSRDCLSDAGGGPRHDRDALVADHGVSLVNAHRAFA